MADRHEGHLGAVYAAAGSRDAIAAGYDAWAESYDQQMALNGYRHPAIGVAMLARFAPRGTGPVLDAGCGTGLLADWLNLLGLTPVEGLDLSDGMLAVAARKGTYARLTRAALGDPLDYADGAFGAVISTGVFTTGHVGAEALPELIRILRPGGAMVLTVKLDVWEGGFATALAASPALKLVEMTAPYVSMPGEPGTIPARCVALLRQ